METFIIITIINFLSLLLVYLINRKVNEGLSRQGHILGKNNEGLINNFSVRIIKIIYPITIIAITVIFYIVFAI